MTELITDRSQADVDRVNALALKGWAKMTQAEREEWLAGLKGAYNASDLNRVESAVATLAEQLVALPDELKDYAAGILVAWDGFFSPPYDSANYTGISTKTDWARPDIPDEGEMARYLGNVALLQAAFSADYPSLPNGMKNLSFDGANAIERVLVLLDGAIRAEQAYKKNLIDNTASAWFYSGEIYANEV